MDERSRFMDQPIPGALYDSDPAHSGQRLRFLRILSGMSQIDLIDSVSFPEVSLRTLIRWEKKGVPIRFVRQVAQFFQCPCEAFFPELMGEIEFKKMVLRQGDKGSIE